MFDLRSLPPYVLEEHRDIDDAPKFWRELPTAEGVARSMIAAAAKAKEKDADAPASQLDPVEMMVHMVASSVYRVDNLGSGGEALVYPSAYAERVEFVRRLPVAWISELGNVVQGDADVDPEAE